MPNVTLILRCNMGEYDEEESQLSTNPKDWEESFYQGDIIVSDMEIIGVKIDYDGYARFHYEEGR